MCSSHYISVLPLSLASVRRRVEAFLAGNGLRMDPMDTYVAISRSEDSDEILAGGGLSGNVIKCVAVSEEARSEGLANKLVSALISLASESGFDSVKVFTKPSNRNIFSSLGFRLLASADEAVLMENGALGLNEYKRSLRALKRGTGNGAVVMNANPFTRGHRYLIERAASIVPNLYVIAVREDLSSFPYGERKAMIEAGCRDLENVTVCEGSDYAVSAATFPTYFLKRLDAASDTQMALDIDLFAKQIAPELGVSVRFAGSEPADLLTARYNELMERMLPERGVEFVQIPRLQDEDGIAFSASRLRKAMDEADFRGIVRTAWPSSLPYVISGLACAALREELETSPKPGLVDRNGNGAHSDMDYAMMRRSIDSLRPYFTRIAVESADRMDAEKIRLYGMEAEKAMLRETGGVNTHRGALFCLGLAVAAASRLAGGGEGMSEDGLRKQIGGLAARMAGMKGSHGEEAVRKYGVAGALESARKAYPALFGSWLPFFRSLSGDPFRNHKTLLRIMTELDDTNVLHRNGPEGLALVKAEAGALLDDFSIAGMEELDRKYAGRRTSPGGSADMLSLTIFIHHILY